ncbi:MAG: ATP synthase F1 subunit gamma [Leptonema sp. (in: bacteria)]
MAGLKEVKKRIGSVKNIRKITKTMEMVSAAKSRKMMLRVYDSQPYGKKILEVMNNLSNYVADLNSPFLKVKDDPNIYLLLVITSNRGLCGAYNSNVLKLARNRIRELQSAGKTIKLIVIGKKAASYFKFIRFPIEKVYYDFDDNFKYIQSKNLMELFKKMYLNNEFDILEVISTHYYSSSSQKPEITQLLPIAPKKGDVNKEISNILILPSKEIILDIMIPYVLEYTLYKLILEAVTSEQIYRRIAMKSASDSANDMTKSLTRLYNRKRQGKITQEISEIVAGADAIK